jgi:hypothetical protein
VGTCLESLIPNGELPHSSPPVVSSTPGAGGVGATSLGLSSTSVGVRGFFGSGSMFHRRRRRDKIGHGEGAEGRKLGRHNPGSIGWKIEVLNKTKEQSVEQQEVLMLFLFP